MYIHSYEYFIHMEAIIHRSVLFFSFFTPLSESGGAAVAQTLAKIRSIPTGCFKVSKQLHWTMTTDVANAVDLINNVFVCCLCVELFTSVFNKIAFNGNSRTHELLLLLLITFQGKPSLDCRFSILFVFVIVITSAFTTFHSYAHLPVSYAAMYDIRRQYSVA